MIKDLLKNAKTLRDNLSLLVLIPTIFGGLWQIFELQSIDTSFIRFFSITQVVADGLLILFVLITVYFSFKFGYIVAADIDMEPFILNRLRKISIPIMAITFMALSVITYLQKNYITAFVIVFFLVPLAMFIGYFTELVNKRKSGNKFFKKIIKILINPLTIAVYIYGSFFLLIFILQLFHNSFLLPQKLKNLENLECLLANDSKQHRILYLNDKFIFVELTGSSKKKRIEILEFKKLFENNCD